MQPQQPITQPVAIPFSLPSAVPPILPPSLPSAVPPILPPLALPSINPITLTTPQAYSAIPGASQAISTAVALAQSQQASGINPTFTYDQFGNAYDKFGNRIDIT